MTNRTERYHFETEDGISFWVDIRDVPHWKMMQAASRATSPTGPGETMIDPAEYVLNIIDCAVADTSLGNLKDVKDGRIEDVLTAETDAGTQLKDLLPDPANVFESIVDGKRVEEHVFEDSGSDD